MCVVWSRLWLLYRLVVIGLVVLLIVSLFVWIGIVLCWYRLWCIRVNWLFVLLICVVRYWFVWFGWWCCWWSCFGRSLGFVVLCSCVLVSVSGCLGWVWWFGWLVGCVGLLGLVVWWLWWIVFSLVYWYGVWRNWYWVVWWLCWWCGLGNWIWLFLLVLVVGWWLGLLVVLVRLGVGSVGRMVVFCVVVCVCLWVGILGLGI